MTSGSKQPSGSARPAVLGEVQEQVVGEPERVGAGAARPHGRTRRRSRTAAGARPGPNSRTAAARGRSAPAEATRGPRPQATYAGRSCWSASPTCPRDATWRSCARSPRRAGPSLIDVHADADHHRSVFTLAGPGARDACRGRPRALAVAVAHGSRSSATAASTRASARSTSCRSSRSAGPTRSEPRPRHEARAFGELVGRGVRRAGVLLRRRRPRAGAISRTPARTASSRANPTSGPDVPHPILGATAVGARRPAHRDQLRARESRRRRRPPDRAR